MRINDPTIVAEIEAELARYEKALVERDLATLDDCFWNDPAGVRRTVISTFGTDFATVSLEFDARRGGIGRQQQSWARLPAGWKVVAAHVSYLPDDAVSS